MTAAASAYDVDLFVIGGGSGGVRAARVAAQHGARVAIAEASRWGGTCVVRGCIPKKLLVYGSEVRALLDDARGYGWTIDGARHDWSALIEAKDREVARLSGRYLATLERHGVATHAARARLADAHTIELDGGRRVTAAHVLIATGARPRPLPAPGAELAITSDELLSLPALPARIAVLGAGYIGVEFAHVLAALGARVTLAHRYDQVLPGFDDDVRAHVGAGLEAAGVARSPRAHATRLERAAGGIRVVLESGPIEVDAVLVAIGRDPHTAGLGLAEAGIALGPGGEVVVDDESRTSLPHVFAVGDVTDRVALTPVAIREGHAVADLLFGERRPPVPHHLVPTAVFAQPPAAAIGLTEAAARAAGHDVAIHKTEFRPLRHALTGRDERTLIKLVVDAPTRRVLGLHLVGADAPEIVQAAAIAITMGATTDDLRATFALHPTSAEELVLLP